MSSGIVFTPLTKEPPTTEIRIAGAFWRSALSLKSGASEGKLAPTGTVSRLPLARTTAAFGGAAGVVTVNCVGEVVVTGAGVVLPGFPIGSGFVAGVVVVAAVVVVCADGGAEADAVVVVVVTFWA